MDELKNNNATGSTDLRSSVNGTKLYAPTPTPVLLLPRRATSTASMTPPPGGIDDLDCRQPREKCVGVRRRHIVPTGVDDITVNGDIVTRTPFSNAAMGDSPLTWTSFSSSRPSATVGKPPSPSLTTVDGFTAYLLQKNATGDAAQFNAAPVVPLTRPQRGSRTDTPDSLDEKSHGDGTRPVVARRLAYMPVEEPEDPTTEDEDEEEEEGDMSPFLVKPTASSSTLCSEAGSEAAPAPALGPTNTDAIANAEAVDRVSPFRQPSPSPLEAYLHSCGIGIGIGGGKGGTTNVNSNPSVPLAPRASSFHPHPQTHRTLSPSIIGQ